MNLVLNTQQTCTYIIERNGRRYNNKTFASYESARKYTLRKIRNMALHYNEWTGTYAYPTLSAANFSIKRV